MFIPAELSDLFFNIEKDGNSYDRADVLVEAERFLNAYPSTISFHMDGESLTAEELTEDFFRRL